MNGLCYLTLAAVITFVTCTSYEGYKVYNIIPENGSHEKIVLSMRRSKNLDFWSRAIKTGRPTTVMVPPAMQNNFQKALQLHQIPHDILIQNFEEKLQQEKLQRASKPKVAKGNVTFDRYLRHDEINAYLNQLAEDHSELVSLETIGQSYEGRDMILVKISQGGRNNPVIFIDAGIHAREWIAPAVALYIIYQLVEVPENAALSQNIDWIILPSVNPDGYEYSWDEDRMWRKTRSPGQSCEGVDANRNFDYHWGESGASPYECDEDFGGTEAFTEVEARNLRDYLLKQTNVRMYLTLHSFGPMLLYPWGYADILADNWKELDDLGNAANDAIKAVTTLDTDYDVGNSVETIDYAAAGASDDWSMARVNASLVYTMELPGGGSNGFDPPEELIRPLVTETWEGIKVFHHYIENGSQEENLF